ncbi:nardilysin-like isoform X2 [Corticium candelabrum]|nr:nardilysin-like isoform X2 [Corticium candelabrum]
MSSQSDTARKLQVLSKQSHQCNPFSKFLWGNAETLLFLPAKQALDVYAHVQDFYARFYSAHYMTLVVFSGETLDTLESWVNEAFSSIPNNGLRQPSFRDDLVDLPFETFHHLVKVRSVKEVNQVDIVWQLPCLHHMYRCKPMHYVGWLLGHEGPGSVLSLLKQKGWALEIVAGNGEEGYEYNTNFSLFTCSIILTEEGFTNVFECCTVVFQYLKMLRCYGPQQRIFDELKTIEEIEFQFQEEMEPVDYVVEIVENMQLFSPCEYLTGASLMFEFNEQMICEIQNALLPSSANITILSHNFSHRELTDVEPWFQTPFVIEAIPKEFDEAWSKLDLYPGLHFPAPNRFIATSFDLKSSDSDSFEPELIYKTDTCKLWFMKDSKFHMPKAYIFLNILSPLVRRSPVTTAMIDLFLCILEHNLKETAYDADVAQFSYGFAEHENGLVLKMNGFSDKLALLFDTITDFFTHFTCNMKDFSVIKAQVSKNYYNHQLNPMKLSKGSRLKILQQVKWLACDRLAVIDSISLKQLEMFVQDFKAYSFIEGLVEGNMTQVESVELIETLHKKLKLKPLSKSQLSQLSNRCLLLPRGVHVRHLENMNESDINSVVTNYYQIGLGSTAKLVLTDLLVYLMEEPCFDVLRTQEQLGYSAFCTCRHTCGVVGLSVTVCTQATKFSTSYVDERIDSFLNLFIKQLKEMPNETFQHHLEGLVHLKLQEDLNLGEVVDRHWPEILDQTYLFDRRKRESTFLKSLSQDEVIEWFVDCIATSKCKRKLSIQVTGYTQSVQDAAAECSGQVADGTTIATPVTEIANEQQESVGNGKKITESPQHDKKKFCEVLTDVINDVCEFKNKNFYYPVWKIQA